MARSRNCSCGGSIKIVELLLTHKANVNAQDDSGLTALMRAAGNEYLYIVELLLKHEADITIKDNSGETVLTHACAHHEGEIENYNKNSILALLLAHPSMTAEQITDAYNYRQKTIKDEHLSKIKWSTYHVDKENRDQIIRQCTNIPSPAIIDLIAQYAALYHHVPGYSLLPGVPKKNDPLLIAPRNALAMAEQIYFLSETPLQKVSTKDDELSTKDRSDLNMWQRVCRWIKKQRVA